ncbi:hypothetical protein L9F63_000966 [Diploptera punctata]|uniref:Large ribosomal subunit protein uL29m n=1 Tax=Diploptera punctata TaxID=6984 RepID=A0AAD8ESW0_DIPPU|nr:hypothetical protein L9F63_000966 [Diploptera punctata]
MNYSLQACSRFTRSILTISKLFTSSIQADAAKCFPRITSFQLCSNFHSTAKRNDLMEFFDDEKNWGQNEVRVGRSWKAEELRIKSNEDLHKLWYILLKEKNMLLTMEEECKQQVRLFPNPERIDKVEESMKNLEKVVLERNEAYFMLETGKTGGRPGYVKIGALGLRHFYRETEHLIPKFMNKKWQSDNASYTHTRDVQDFLQRYKERKFLEKRKARNREKNHVLGLMRRFPNLDMEAVKEQFPSVNIEKIRNSKKARGHKENTI